MDFQSFQDVIMKIQGVTHAKVVADDEGVREVHVIAGTSRSAKQIVRDIESALLAIFEYRVDRKIISIAQIDTGEMKKTINRIIYQGISVHVEDNNVECEVRLSCGDEEFVSTKSAISTSANRKKVVARATISAVEKVIGRGSIFDIEDVVLNKSRDINFVNVVTNMITRDDEEILIGTAIVRSDVNEAIAKATLDALNRRVMKQ